MFSSNTMTTVNGTLACMGAGCFFSSTGQPPCVYFGVSALLAFAVFLLQTGVVVFHVRATGTARPHVLTTFLLLWMSVLLRGVWFTQRASNRDGISEHFINRFSVLLFFSGFSMYLQMWVRFVHATSGFGSRPSEVATTMRELLGSCLNCISCSIRTRETPSWVWNLSLNACNWVLVFALSFASELGGCEACKNWGYILLSLECFLLSVGFLVFGSRMYARLRDPGRFNMRVRLIAMKVLCVLSVCCVCFGVRTIFWLWEPISGNFSPNGTYPFMHYTVTGLVPSLVLFVIMAPAGRVQRMQLGVASSRQHKVSKDIDEGISEEGESGCRVGETHVAVTVEILSDSGP